MLPSGTGRWTGEAALAELRRAVVSREDTVSQESAAGPLPHAARRQVSIVLLDELDGLLQGEWRGGVACVLRVSSWVQ